MENKVALKFILASDPKAPFKTISVEESTPFSVCIKHIAHLFGQNPATCAIITEKGIGVNPKQTAGNVFLKFGSTLKIIPRDRVGSISN